MYPDPGTLAPLLNGPGKRGLRTRDRMESCRRKLFFPDGAGRGAQGKALPVPPAAEGCPGLSKEDFPELKHLPDKALFRMEAHT